VAWTRAASRTRERVAIITAACSGRRPDGIAPASCSRSRFAIEWMTEQVPRSARHVTDIAK
jgi:hypothetical protein